VQSANFQLDDEHRARIIDCLSKAGIRLNPDVRIKLMSNLERSIEAFLKVRSAPHMTSRQLHDALRGVWLLAHEEVCPVAQLRARVQQLPKPALDYLERRAAIVFPSLFRKKGKRIESRFLTWVGNARSSSLVRVVRVLSAEGGQPVARSRGDGKRSHARLEPRILGQSRGAGDGALRTGRPKHTDQQDLIRWLAIDWINATGNAPTPGRSDRRGFGDLVHSVFQWLEEPSPNQALRRYWREAKESQARTAKRERGQVGS
jgi:hypothetical protein